LAPEIAVDQVLEPIAWRVERELAEQPKLLPRAGIAPNLAPSAPSTPVPEPNDPPIHHHSTVVRIPNFLDRP
jgi:hypothetical protein